MLLFLYTLTIHRDSCHLLLSRCWYAQNNGVYFTVPSFSTLLNCDVVESLLCGYFENSGYCKFSMHHTTYETKRWNWCFRPCVCCWNFWVMCQDLFQEFAMHELARLCFHFLIKTWCIDFALLTLLQWGKGDVFVQIERVCVDGLQWLVVFSSLARWPVANFVRSNWSMVFLMFSVNKKFLFHAVKLVW